MSSELSRKVAYSLDVGSLTVEFEFARCDDCGSVEDIELFTGVDRQLHLPGTFRVATCRGCGLIRQNPRPTADTIDAYYDQSYGPFQAGINAERRWWRRLDREYGQMKRRRLIEQHCQRGTILDVGAATGNFLAYMSRTGHWSAVGVEPSTHAADRARREHGLDVKTSTLAAADFPAGSFDVVTLWNVLEHLHEPVRGLRQVERLLRPGGLLVFSVPNLESFEVRLFGRAWLGWELPRHLYLFPRTILNRILRETGFALIRRECLSASQMSFTMSVRRLFQPGEPFPPWCGPAIWFLESFPGRVLLAPFFFGVSQAKQATIVTYVARKR